LHSNSNEEVAVWDVTWRVALLGAVFATDLLVFIRLFREELMAEQKRVRRPRRRRARGVAWAMASPDRTHRRFAVKAIRWVALD
jgi:hypothetical protein